MTQTLNIDVLIIGAGPAGSMAAAFLAQQGISALIVEKTHFPRFVIGESLLAQSMDLLEKAGLYEAVKNAGFQLKDGAAFSQQDRRSEIRFSEKTTAGHGTTFQVERACFDKILTDEVQKMGVEVRFGHSVDAVELHSTGAHVDVHNEKGETFRVECRFIVDASGYGRVLPRLLNLEAPSDFPVRQAIFTHISDHLVTKDFDRNKILISIHPDHSDIWYWLIPFTDGKASVGVITTPQYQAGLTGDASDKLWQLIAENPHLHELLSDAVEKRPAATIGGYSSNVTTLSSDRFALLGNAGEFLDPVFSSGVTVAMKSAELLIAPLLRQLKGETVDWQQEFDAPLAVGVQCFKAFVEAWYEGSLQKIVLAPSPEGDIVRRQIVSVLAGYAWDETNVFVRNPKKYLNLVALQCE
ncbi:NAD(P)/FAD-dependent oxidoreductase [Halocynthiibacter namhaensis]|uniref:NAD(P)/FAD-dependent oxidoreductase n=1 Tax=Halocynthiibacter namhaensis TaxID=1290553 RepID=UPI0005790478|nr:NAD(P)/FAD-dependent oxidoreductase [Halocynthiibacter namhaensis]